LRGAEPAEGVRFEVLGPVAHVTLCRPAHLNAQTPSMWRALADFGSDLPRRVRAVVVQGEGAAFSAGLDRRMFTPEGIPGEPSLAGLATLDPDEAARVVSTYQAGFSWLRRPDVISVAIVHGHAVGAGFQLALACDLRIAATDAQFTMAEPMLGLVPDLGGTQPLVAAVGYSRALELCATGRRLGAAEAERWGLVNLLVGREDLARATSDLVQSLLAGHRDAVTATKELLLEAATRTYDGQLLAERVAQVARVKALASPSD
jgi:enoyl-CoA hydratase/carnithine racemase